MAQAREQWMWSLIGVAWLSALAVGGRVLWSYSFTPGQAAIAQVRWPAASRLPLDPHRPTLVMMAHPHCPCTRASVGELTSLLQRLHGHLSTHVVFVLPSGMPPDWEKTDTWRSAQGIPGVKVWTDVDGVETARFGGRTSGQVLLYDPEGRLLFSGGITPQRGHPGDSAGQERIVSLVATGKADAATSRVFGCALGR
jgi:hypothetical protein